MIHNIIESIASIGGSIKSEDQCCQPINPLLCNFVRCKTNSCAPDLCNMTSGTASKAFCEINKDKFITFDQLYSGLYIANEQILLLTKGIPEMMQHKTESWIISSIILQNLPFIVMMIILFLILMTNKTINVFTGIILIILSIILPIISFTIFGKITSDAANDIFTNVKQIIKQNWNKYENQISCDMSHAIICPDAIKCK